MEALYLLLQGSYGYLLIFQILVVTSLFVAFLWMMAQRTKSENYSFAAPAEGPTVTSVSAVTPSEYQQLKEKCLKLEEENTKMLSLKEEYEGLLQKTKFLESKLLEYEILQEEIGTLGSLKVENETLKGELQTLQREIAGSKGKQAYIPPAVPAAAAAAPAPEVAVPPIPNMDFSMGTPPAPPTVSLEAAPPPPPAAEVPSEPAADSTLPPPDNGLDGLLKQIDSLTQNQQQK